MTALFRSTNQSIISSTDGTSETCLPHENKNQTTAPRNISFQKVKYTFQTISEAIKSLGKSKKGDCRGYIDLI